MRACPRCGTANVEAAKFCNGCGGRLSAVPEPRRRFVTALFCDLVGSTGLGQRLSRCPSPVEPTRSQKRAVTKRRRGSGTAESRPPHPLQNLAASTLAVPHLG